MHLSLLCREMPPPGTPFFWRSHPVLQPCQAASFSLLCEFSPSCLELLPVLSPSLKGCLPKSNPSACFIFSIWFLYALGIRLLLLSCCLGDSIVPASMRETKRFAFLVLTARARSTTGGRHFAQSCAIWLLQSGKPQLSIYIWGLLTLSSFVLFFSFFFFFPSLPVCAGWKEGEKTLPPWQHLCPAKTWSLTRVWSHLKAQKTCRIFFLWFIIRKEEWLVAG